MKNTFTTKQIFILVVILASGVLFFSKSIFVEAAINPLLDFQGKIINIDGTNVLNGVYDFDFKIYDDSLGGTLLWSESLNASSSFAGIITGATISTSSIAYTFTPVQATSTLRVGQYLTNASASSSHAIIVDIDIAANELTVESTASGTAWSIGDNINNRPRIDGGVAMLNLGTVSDLTILDFNSPMYLETTFDSEIMQPRKPFTSVTQSFNTSFLDGRAETEFAALDDNETITGQWSFTDILDINASSTSAALTITQNGSGNLIEVKSGASTAFSVLANGRVAIGAYIMPEADGFPGYVLKSDGSGNVSWEVDLAGFGGSGLWATSSNSTIIRPVDTSQIVVVGNTATSSDGYIFEVDGSALFDNISISDENEMRFYDSGNTNYFALKASSTLGVDRIFTLPTNAYLDEDALMVDSSGNMFWGKRAGLWGDDGANAYYTAGNVLIGTTTNNSLLTVGSTAGSQFLVNTSGQIIEGEWNGTIIDTPYGGTGRSSWSQYAIPYLTGTSTFGEVTIGTGNYLLGVNPGATGYSWIDPNSVGTNLSLENVEDIAGELIASSSGTHTLISVLYNDASSNMDFIVETDLSQYSNATSSFFSTTTDLLGVAYGGTGTTTFEANSLLYASAQNIISEVLEGLNGNILQSVSGVPTWVATSSLGIDFNAIGGTLDPNAGGTGQDSDAWNGIAFVTGGVWSAVPVLPVISGGTGATSLNDLITLGTHTTGDYLANVTGAGSIVITGALGEGVTRVIDVIDDSITPIELNVSGNGVATNILTSNGSGGFTWVAQGSVGTDTTLSQEQVEDFAGLMMATTTGTHTLITITYDDSNNNMDFVVDNDLANYDNTTTAFIDLASLSSTATGLTYNAGVFSLTTGYEIPTSINTGIWANTANTVSASSSDWTTAFDWGDHSTQNYFDLDGAALAITEGGTGATSLNDLITLGTHTTGDYLANVTGAGSIVITGALGEGVTRVIDVIDDSITPIELNVSGNGVATNILTSDGSGGFTWVAQGTVGTDTTLSQEQVEDYSGELMATTTGTHTLITVAYNDNAGLTGSMDFTVENDLSLYDNSTSSFFSTISDILDVVNGGTGLNTLTQNALIYASSTSEFAELGIGASSTILQVNASADGYEWVPAGSVGVDTNLSREEVEDFAGALMSTSSPYALIEVVYNDVSNTMSFNVSADLSQYSNATSSFITLESLSNTATGLAYSTTTGIFSIASGYEIPTTANTLSWTNTATLVSASSTDWTNTYDLVNASSSNWTEAFDWGDHSSQNYFDLDGVALPIIEGGTGAENASDARDNLGLTIGTNVQAYDVDLVTYAGISPSANIQTLLGSTDNADARSNLGLGTIATQNANSVTITGGSVTNITDITVTDGGTGRSSWTQYAIPYMSDSTTFGQLGIGASTTLLRVNSAGTGYEWVATGEVGVDTNLNQEEVEDYAGQMIELASGNHSLISITYDDANNDMDFIVENDLSQYDNGTSSFITLGDLSSSIAAIDYASASGIFSLNGSYIISTVASTSEYNTAFSWGDHSTQNYFDTDTDVLDIAQGGTGSSTAAGARVELGLGDLAVQDTINNDDWLGTDLAVVNGGTGKSSWTPYAIPYMTDATTFGEVPIGASSTLLQVNPTGDGFVWKPIGEVGVDTFLSQEEVEDYAGAMVGTTSLITITYNDDIDGQIEYIVTSDLSLFDNSVSQFFSTTTDILGLAYGGTGAVSAAGARTSLGLDDVATFGINSTGTDGQIWQSDGDGRGQWVATSSLGIVGGESSVSKFVGTTTATFDGAFATSSLSGYTAANELCDEEFPGSHFCRVYDILVTIEQDDISSWGDNAFSAWVAEGPPGYTVDSNDCKGWTESVDSMLGAYWKFNGTTGGAGYLIHCGNSLSLACCGR